jgi:hypothetical protein
MTLPQVYDLVEYWQENPPVNEIAAMFATVYTTWRPAAKPMTHAEHMESLERRWASGQAMNIKQMYEALGGNLSGHGPSGQAIAPEQMPGIGPFPSLLAETMH